MSNEQRTMNPVRKTNFFSNGVNNKLGKTGFSLTEVLLAVGTLAIGLMFIGGTFIVGIHFSTLATERTIAAVVTDEAFAKIKLYGSIDTSWLSALHSDDCNDFSELVPVDVNEFAYPSTDTDLAEKQYFWSALCRLTEPNTPTNPNPPVQVTVFVCKKIGAGTVYRDPLNPISATVGYPMPVRVSVLVTGNANEIRIEDVALIDGIEKTFINDGYTIVDDENGRIYRVLKRYADDPDTPLREDEIILLDRSWDTGVVSSDKVWVVPPPIGGGRYPCIAVYQTTMRF